MYEQKIKETKISDFNVLQHQDISLRNKINFNGNLLISASWEDRSISIHRALNQNKLKKLNKVAIVSYKNKGETGRALRHLKQHKEFFKKNNVKEFCVDTRDGTLKNYYNIIRDISDFLDDRIPLLFDISALPRFIWGGFLSKLIRDANFQKICFFYSQPRYEMEPSEENHGIYEYTRGNWNFEKIPFHPEVFSRGLRRVNLISTGFEYEKTKNIIHDLDINRNAIIMAYPGFNDQYTKYAKNTLRKLTKLFVFDKEQVLKVKVNDPLGVMVAADKWFLSHTGSEFYKSIYCTGNKLHTLGLLLYSLSETKVDLFMRRPSSYRERNTVCNGNYDFIELTNRFYIF